MEELESKIVSLLEQRIEEGDKADIYARLKALRNQYYGLLDDCDLAWEEESNPVYVTQRGLKVRVESMLADLDAQAWQKIPKASPGTPRQKQPALVSRELMHHEFSTFEQFSNALTVAANKLEDVVEDSSDALVLDRVHSMLSVLLAVTTDELRSLPSSHVEKDAQRQRLLHSYLGAGDASRNSRALDEWRTATGVRERLLRFHESFYGDAAIVYRSQDKGEWLAFAQRVESTLPL